MPQGMILVCAGADSKRAQASGLPVLHLGLGLRPDGSLYRLMLSATQNPGCYLGVCDRGMTRFCPAVCDQLLTEAERVGAAGLVVDCERSTPPIQALMQALDEVCSHKGVPLFVPLSQAKVVSRASLIVDTALSGGSLWERFGALVEQYPGRITADLRPISRDFLLPAPDSDGVPLEPQAREALRRRAGSQAFFSRELCARYFTYMDEAGNGHFVLFDDDDTLREKCGCLESLGVAPIFARYPDVCALLG